MAEAGPRWTFISIALFVLGLLIFIPAGLCVVAIAVEEASATRNSS